VATGAHYRTLEELLMSRRMLRRLSPIIALLPLVMILAVMAQLDPTRPVGAQVVSTATVTPTPTATATSTTGPTTSTPGICGTITSFTEATATTPGSISFSNINTNQTFVIAAGTNLVGAGAATANANVCVRFTLNAAGAVVAGTFAPNAATAATVCGPVTAFVPATLSSTGSVTIGGITFPTAIGTTFTGTVTSGQNQSIAFQMNGIGLINTGTVTAGTCTGTLLQGPFGNFQAPTATQAGFVTLGGVTFIIAAGTNVRIAGVPLAAILVSSWNPIQRLGRTVGF
jgi:hypothetical protein